VVRSLTVMAMVLAVLAGCGSNAPASAPATPEGGPATSTIPAASTSVPSASRVICDDETTGCTGPLAAGKHQTANFDHAFSFVVGDGWTNGRDIYRAYTLSSVAVPNAEFIVWSHAAPAMQTPDCTAARRPGFGTSVAEWLRSLSTDDRLDVTKRETFSLGAHAATRVEVATKPTFTAMCPLNTDPFAVIVTDTENPPTRAHGGAEASMTLVDFGDDAVVIWNDRGDGTLQGMLRVSLPVVESIRFAS